MKNISLSQEVKTIVRGMVSNAAKFKLEVLTTFLLFDSMMSQKQFSSLIAKYSSCNLEGIINLIENIYKNNPLGFNEKEVETIEERDILLVFLRILILIILKISFSLNGLLMSFSLLISL